MSNHNTQSDDEDEDNFDNTNNHNQSEISRDTMNKVKNKSMLNLIILSDHSHLMSKKKASDLSHNESNKEYHLLITDNGRYLDTSYIPNKIEKHKAAISFDKMTSKQYISPKYASSEIKHSNPEFNRLDIKEVKTKVPSFDMKYGETRDIYFKKLWSKLPG